MEHSSRRQNNWKNNGQRLETMVNGWKQWVPSGNPLFPTVGALRAPTVNNGLDLHQQLATCWTMVSSSDHTNNGKQRWQSFRTSLPEARNTWEPWDNLLLECCLEAKERGEACPESHPAQEEALKLKAETMAQRASSAVNRNHNSRQPRS